MIYRETSWSNWRGKWTRQARVSGHLDQYVKVQICRYIIVLMRIADIEDKNQDTELPDLVAAVCNFDG